jgi:multidrug efflux pump subunit AcrA (membrane-fusion protein)
MRNALLFATLSLGMLAVLAWALGTKAADGPAMGGRPLQSAPLSMGAVPPPGNAVSPGNVPGNTAPAASAPASGNVATIERCYIQLNSVDGMADVPAQEAGVLVKINVREGDLLFLPGRDID